MRLLRSSAGHDPLSLVPGRDLVLEPAVQHGLDLPAGVAVEDHLDSAGREACDSAANAAMARWRAARGDALRIEGVALDDVWEVELLAQCFLPAERLRRTGLRPTKIEGFDAGALQALRELYGAEGTVAPPPAPPPRHGSGPLLRRLASVPVPALVRGNVLCVPYWMLGRVVQGLPRPVAFGIRHSHMPPDASVRATLRGGWAGRPGLRALADSSRRVADRLADLQRLDTDDPELRALDAWALRVLARLAGPTLAHGAWARATVQRGVRILLTPFDSPETVRVVLGAGLQSVVVQHGFDAGLNDPDKTRSDHAAVWSAHDAERLRTRAAGEVVITGNPGADDYAVSPRSWRGGTAAVVLVEYHGRLSARVGLRVTLQHVAAALRGLAAARPAGPVVVRPHPSDAETEMYLRLARTAAPGLRVSVDRRTPIDDLMAVAGLCVGALSTATLQAAVLGVPTLLLDVSGANRPWPFDGSGLPVARDAQELAAICNGIADAQELGRDALGVTGHATADVVALLEDL